MRLIGEDGNVSSIIGRVVGVLRDGDQAAAADEFRSRAFAAGSYDEVLQLVTEFVEVE